jgi:hypothetical protein
MLVGQTGSIAKIKSLTKLAVWGFPLVGSTAFNFNALNTYDQTWSGKRFSTT